MPEKGYFAVIAGRLAETKHISDNQFTKIPDLIRNAFKRVNEIVNPAERFDYEIIRMDEFMAKSDSPSTCIANVLMLMSAYRSLSDTELGIKSELSLSIGVGPVEFLQKQLRESDGTAFRFAMKGLIKLKRSQRISIFTPDENINDEFRVTCGFMDILIREWSDEQAEALFLKLLRKNQVEISEKLKISQPAVNRRLKAAHYDATEQFIKRAERLLSNINK